ncbi:hypothetical protein BpHYR1_036290 [Brachionus plicatilis]|uniref:Uncharacterized protein n=1 Tax=Brachionus plicatilis TaxID=10195 RepID=A0A3M7PYD8_BRAPC|nr:hypothetical protein BpHYR1_036290 [Brachionus plicatilis]
MLINLRLSLLDWKHSAKSRLTTQISCEFNVYSVQFIQHVARLFIKTSTCQCAGNECMHGLAQHAHRLLIQTSACNCTANRVHTQ